MIGKRTLIIGITTGIMIGAAALFLLTLQRAFRFDDSEIDAGVFGISLREGALSNAPEPKRLAVPAIGVDAPINPVGINEKGNIAAPASFSEVGWYKYGPKPGEAGTAVLDGHLNNALGLAGVFQNLKNIKTDDEITVTGADGSTIRFRVTDIKRLSYSDPPPKEVFETSGRARLVLITCDGSWIRAAKTYSERLVVTAELY